MIRIDDALARFLVSPVMVIVGSRDAAHRAEIGRAVGVRAAAGESAFEIVISTWQWPDTVANLAAEGAAAVTFSRPGDYATYQLKGMAEVRPADDADRRLAARYIRDVTATLAELGLHPDVIAPWLCDRDLVTARVRLVAAFLQTPGAQAGAPLEGTP